MRWVVWVVVWAVLVPRLGLVVVVMVTAEKGFRLLPPSTLGYFLLLEGSFVCFNVLDLAVPTDLFAFVRKGRLLGGFFHPPFLLHDSILC